jgi:hypothetical protein
MTSFASNLRLRQKYACATSAWGRTNMRGHIDLPKEFRSPLDAYRVSQKALSISWSRAGPVRYLASQIHIDYLSIGNYLRWRR